MPVDRAARAHRAALTAGFDVPLLADYCRSQVRGGLIVGFGGCTDDELDRALTVLVEALAT
jgi:GntR family transcriptional regulator/MocR family aminotransferase